jgi:hypothetical protein
MANSRTGADISDAVLRRCGELTSGNSSYEAQVLEYLSHIQRTIIIGGNEFSVDVNEVWNWSKAKYPMIINLSPKYNTGTISVTEGSEAGTLSVASASSLKGWHLRPDNKDVALVITTHTAGGTAVEFDGAYPFDTDATLTFTAFKLDYELTPDYLIVDALNKQLPVTDTGGTVVLSMTEGVYTPGDLATHMDTILDADGTLDGTFTITYDGDLRKFSFVSDTAGTLDFGTGAVTKSAAALLGFDDAQITIGTTAVLSTYEVGDVGKLIQPFQVYRNYGMEGEIQGMNENKFQEEYPFQRITEGTPTRFGVLYESDGKIIVRFNKYPSTDNIRIVVPYVPNPRDVTDSALCKPVIPLKFIQVLEYGATHLTLVDKNDNKAQHYLGLAQAKLNAMIKEARTQAINSGKDYGGIIPRRDQLERYNNRIQFRGYEG